MFAGLALMGACMTWFEFSMYCVCIIAFIVGCVVLGLAICLKRQIGGASSSRGSKGGKKGGPPRKRPPPKKGSGGGGAKVGAKGGPKQGWS